MAALVRAGFAFAKNAIIPTSSRAICTTQPLKLKEIHERKEGSTLVVEAVNVPSPRTELLIRAENVPSLAPLPTDEKGNPPCYMCALDLDVKHTDVLILSQFVRSDGCMLPRRITGLCRRQQKKIGKMVTMAQKAGLMINLTPAYCKKDPTKRYGHKKFNTYFDEKTIFWKRIPKQNDRFKRTAWGILLYMRVHCPTKDLLTLLSFIFITSPATWPLYIGSLHHAAGQNLSCLLQYNTIRHQLPAYITGEKEAATQNLQ